MAGLKDTVTVVVDNCGGAHFKDMLDVLCVGGRYVGVQWYRFVVQQIYNSVCVAI
jgi:hypothetical protein